MGKKRIKWGNGIISAVFVVKRTKKRVNIEVLPKIKDGYEGSVDEGDLIQYGTACAQAGMNAMSDHFKNMDYKGLMDFHSKSFSDKSGEQQLEEVINILGGAEHIKEIIRGISGWEPQYEGRIIVKP